LDHGGASAAGASKSKARAQAIFCMSKQPAIDAAWTLYSAENNDGWFIIWAGFQPSAEVRPAAWRQPTNRTGSTTSWMGVKLDNTIPPSSVIPTPCWRAYRELFGEHIQVSADRVLMRNSEERGLDGAGGSMSMNAMVGDAGI